MSTAGTAVASPVGWSADEVLARSRSLVDPALRDAVDTLPESIRRVVEYHFGWCDGAGGGKAVRPALVLLAADAVGRAQPAVSAAAAVELLHNYSLLHDDVMDGDRTRRHRPTAWTVFGPEAAILAGNALLALAFQVLARTGHPAAAEGAGVLGDAHAAMVEGQYADISLPDRPDVTLADCLDMSARKTGALLAGAAALGATFGGGSAEQVRCLRSFGANLGLAFQLVDDQLDIWGDPRVTGKPAASDIRHRKKSLVVVFALESQAQPGYELASLYGGRQPLSDRDVARAVELIERTGARTWASATVEALCLHAMGDLDRAEPAPRAAAELRELAWFITRRGH